MNALEEELSAREKAALAVLDEAKAELARRRLAVKVAAANADRADRHAGALSRARAATARELATTEAAETDRRVLEAAEGKDFSAGVSDYLIELRDDLSIDEERERDFGPVRARLREAHAEEERGLREAERAVRTAAVAVVSARVKDDLDVLLRARADVERCEQRIEGVLRLTSGVLHRHQDQLVHVVAPLREYGPWQRRTYAPRTDPLRLAEDAALAEFIALLDGIAVAEEH